MLRLPIISGSSIVIDFVNGVDISNIVVPTIILLLTKISDAQIEIALSYHRVRGQFLLW